MNKFIKTLTVISGVFIFTAAVASQTPSQGAVFQVVQSQMIFDKANVQSASVIRVGKYIHYSKDEYGVQLVLTPAGAKQFSEITQNGIKKVANTVVNGKIVMSATLMGPLGKNVIFPLPNKHEAEQYVKSLGLQK